MVEAARRNDRVVQVGTQSRSTAHVRRAVELLHDGAIGEVLSAKAWNSQRRRSIGRSQESEPPHHLDFDLWTGPAPVAAYRPNMLHGTWRWWHSFGCGDTGNDGVHDLDIARWGLGVGSHPAAVAATGGKYFFDDDMEWPDTQTAIFEYAPDEGTGRPRQLIYEQRIWSPYVQEGYENGNAWYGTGGMLLLGKSSGWKLFGERNMLRDEMEGRPDLDAHHQDFLECIRNGGRPNADIETGHLSSALCHLANIATLSGRSFRFDPERESVEDDDAAHALLQREYREHWATPKGV
jgi:predicted dehydrogenase